MAYDEDFTIVTTLPDDIENGSILCFMVVSDVQVYINGELRKEFINKRDSGIPGGALKEFYMQVPLDSTDEGAEIRIKKYRTERNPMVVSETFISSSEGIYDYMVIKYGNSFLYALVLLIASLLASVVGNVMRLWMRQRIFMLYSALGILDVACWLIAVSQFTPFVTGIYYVDGFMGFLFCMMMPFALLIYFNSIQKSRYKKCVTILFIVGLLNMIVFLTLHFLGIRSLTKSIVFIDGVLGIIILCMFITLIIDIKKKYVLDYTYMAKGFMLFMIMSLLETIKIVFFEKINNEAPMIIGLFGLLVSVVIQQVYDINKATKELEEELHTKALEKEQLLIHIVETLAGTIDAKDNYTKGHSSRVADAYDAMTSYRSYREPMSQEQVRSEIENGIGTQFDPHFGEIMLEMIDEDKNYEMREK